MTYSSREILLLLFDANEVSGCLFGTGDGVSKGKIKGVFINLTHINFMSNAKR